MLGTKKCFRCQIVKYLLTQKNISGMRSKFQHKAHLCFMHTLYTQPEDDFLSYFQRTCALTVTCHMRSGVELCTCGIMSSTSFNLWSVLDFGFLNQGFLACSNMLFQVGKCRYLGSFFLYLSVEINIYYFFLLLILGKSTTHIHECSFTECISQFLRNSLGRF